LRLGRVGNGAIKGSVPAGVFDVMRDYWP